MAIFDSFEPVQVDADVLVIGGGIAAMMAAIAATEDGASVVLSSKSTAGRGGESVMAAGVYLAYDGSENLCEWVKESIEISDGMDDPHLVGKCIQVSEVLRNKMDKWGVDWEKRNGRFTTKSGLGMINMKNAMFREGRQLMSVLRGVVSEVGVRIMDRTMITDLLTSDGQMPTQGAVIGAIGFNIRKPVIYQFNVKSVVLASGAWGINQFQPMDITGDGQAMAFRLGAYMRSMEHIGFSFSPIKYPSIPGLHALTGHGAYFINSSGDRYMSKYSPDLMERSPRPVIIRAAAKEIEEGNGPLFLDGRHLTHEDYARISRVVPSLFKALKSIGISIDKDLVEYAPTLYGNGPMGGIMINENCETNISGLYAAGGVTDRMYAGIPGLTGASATGYIAGLAAAGKMEESGDEPVQDQVQSIIKAIETLSQKNGEIEPDVLFKEAQDLILNRVGVYKDYKSLVDASAELELLTERLRQVYAKDLHCLMNAIEIDSILQIAEVIIKASKVRKESRYMHNRRDYPFKEDKQWSCHLICSKNQQGELNFQKIPFKTGWEDSISNAVEVKGWANENN